MMESIKLDKSKYLKDQINETEVRCWRDNKVILDCPTGMGKTTLINKLVCKVAEKQNGIVLFLSSRLALTEQQLRNLKNLGVKNVEVKTYQWLENRLKNDLDESIKDFYDFIVADECHYFTNDATFNDDTSISYKWLKEQPTVIYMSATGYLIFKYMENTEQIDLYYYADRNYSQVSTITFCHSDEHMIECIKDVYNSNDKMIVFMDKLLKDGALGTRTHTPIMQWCLNHREDSHFICSKYREQFQEINEFDTAIVNEKFEKQFLFTTQALEVGIDINDEQCKHIMVEMFDWDSIIQALGRIRNKQGIHYYIRVYDKQTLCGKAQTLKNNRLDKVKAFNNLETFEQHYHFCRGKGNFNSYNGLFYIDVLGDRDIKVNELMHYKYKDIYNQYMVCMNSNGGEYSEHPHVNSLMIDFISFDFQGEFIDLGERDKINGTNEINEYLESLVDIKLNKQQQLELIEKLNVRGKDGVVRKTVKPLNRWLSENGFDYIIVNKKSIWTVTCLE